MALKKFPIPIAGCNQIIKCDFSENAKRFICCFPKISLLQGKTNYEDRNFNLFGLQSSLSSLCHRRTLSLYYICLVFVLMSLGPKALLERNTRFSNDQYPFSAKLDRIRANSLTSSFIPMNSKENLPPSIARDSYSPPTSEISSLLFLFKTQGSILAYKECNLFISI